MSNSYDSLTRTEHDQALATTRAKAIIEGRSLGEAAGRAAAMERLRAILTSPEAKARWQQALVFALDHPDMPAAAAIAALAASPRTQGRPSLDARGNGAMPHADRWDASLRRAGATLPDES